MCQWPVVMTHLLWISFIEHACYLPPAAYFSLFFRLPLLPKKFCLRPHSFIYSLANLPSLVRWLTEWRCSPLFTVFVSSKDVWGNNKGYHLSSVFSHVHLSMRKIRTEFLLKKFISEDICSHACAEFTFIINSSFGEIWSSCGAFRLHIGSILWFTQINMEDHFNVTIML